MCTIKYIFIWVWIFCFCPSVAVWAIYDSHFQCKKRWRPYNHRTFKCTVQEYKKVSKQCHPLYQCLALNSLCKCLLNRHLYMYALFSIKLTVKGPLNMHFQVPQPQVTRRVGVIRNHNFREDLKQKFSFVVMFTCLFFVHVTFLILLF